MADPTLKDVLKALAEIRSTMATKADLAALDAKVDARFDAVDAAISSLDEDIEKHMVVHKRIEKDVIALKAKPARPAARALRRR